MRIYRWLLRLAPPALRREYGAAMEEAFSRRLEDAERDGLPPRVRLWRREIVGLVALAISEWWRLLTLWRDGRQLQAQRKAGRMDGIRQEIRHAARRLIRTPAFTIPTLLTLALAVGANVSIFAVVHRVLLNPLPYPASERIVALEFSMPSRNVPQMFVIPERLYQQYRDRSRTLDSIAVSRSGEVTLTGDGLPERIRVTRTTASLAAVLGVPPAEGRWFRPDEDVPGASPVTVISHGLWVRRFARDPRVVGQVVRLDGVPTTVVGVMPSSFSFPDARVDLWLPVPFVLATEADSYYLAPVARLRDGVAISAARAELTRLAVELEMSFPRNGYGQLVSIATPLIEATVGRVSTMLWVLLTSVGLVLLVACANVANLFLVRSEIRQKEVAVRQALGAGRSAIARYFLTESALLSATGGVLGLALAFGAVHLLIALGPANLPRLGEIRIDGTVLAFTVGLVFATAAAFGAIPLLRRAAIITPLHDSGRGNTAARHRHRARHLLMASQVALALVLLIASGLMLRSFQNLTSVDPGFEAGSTLTFRIGLPRADYPDRAAMAAAHRAILDNLSGMPGVESASASTCLPLAEQQLCQAGPLFVERRPLPAGTLAPFVAIRGVAGGYFETMGMTLHRGRGIERADVDGEELVAVVNQALADMVFGDEDPIGRRIRLGNPALARGTPDWLTVVGVVANTPTFGLAEMSPFPQMFTPLFASRPVNMAPRLDAMSFVVRATDRPEPLIGEVRRVVRAVDGNLAIAQLQMLQDVLDRASAQMAFTMILLAIAATVALTLGVIGVYGVMSYVVTQRTGEIGVRLTLGAKPGSVAAAIVRQGGTVAAAGIAVGLGTAFAAGRAIQSLLYGISPRDPAVFAATTALLVVAAACACWIPARRAARLNPVDALRAE